MLFNAANLDQFLAMARDVCQVDMENSKAIEAMELASQAQTEEEFDTVSKSAICSSHY